MTYLNYRGVYATLTLNFFITAIAFVTIFILLFGTQFYSPDFTLLRIEQITNGLPYGWINMVFGFMFYFIASLWFTMHRSKFMDEETFIEAGADYWPRPQGY